LREKGGFAEYLGTLPRSLRVLVIASVAALIGAAMLGLGIGGEGDYPEESCEEEELADICSLIEGVGECRVMISRGEDDSVEAVAVVCEGADDPGVRARLIKMIGSLYGIGSNRISVMKISEYGHTG